ncbi:MAG: DUF4142 domain-containing protein [Ramlibacter sp.]|nr:DUF4142 domain-containing protein [Ramlibacter sp.]
MKCVSVGVAAAAAVVGWTGAVLAADQARPVAARAAVFAASAAVNIKPMAMEQRDERRFLKDATAASRFQTEASRLAMAKSGNARVRSLAALLLNHHTEATSHLLHMLHVRGMAPPMLENNQRKALNRLVKLQGAKFDRAFMEELGLKLQQQDVQQYERASVAVRDPLLKSWIDQSLPALRHHLATAERTVPADTRPVRSAGSGRTAQAGPAKPIAARPSESNIR